MKKDVYKYFASMQDDYNKLLQVQQKLNDEIEKGWVSPEQIENFQVYFNTVKSNYERVAYIYYLLNLPPKFVLKFKKALIKQFAKEATLEGVKEENKAALEKLALDSEGDSECL